MGRSGGGGLIQKSRGEAKPFLFVLAAVAALGRAGTFALYAGLGVLALIFFATRVPETTGAASRRSSTNSNASAVARPGAETMLHLWEPALARRRKRAIGK
jgi:hypothetical protein